MRQQPPTIFAPAANHSLAAAAQSPGVAVPDQLLVVLSYTSPEFGYTKIYLFGKDLRSSPISSNAYCGGVQLIPTATTDG